MARITEEQVSKVSNEINDTSFAGNRARAAKIIMLLTRDMLIQVMDLNHVDPDLGTGVRGRRALAEACGTDLSLADLVGGQMDIQTAEFEVEKAWIDRDMAHAVTLDFGPYIGYLDGYGRTLRGWAARYTAPEIAFRKLRAYADEALDRARDNAATAGS